jgi:tetratricopeptide (TPR) repeat protein
MCKSTIFLKSILSAVLIICFAAASAQDAKFYSAKADAFYKLKDFDQAISNYNAAINLDPGYVWAYVWRGNAYFGKKLYEAGIKDFNQAIILDPANEDAYIGRANSYSALNKTEEAIQDYSSAISINPNKAWGYANRAFLYARKKQYDWAIRDYSKAISIDPVYTWAYINRGFVYSQTKQYDLSIQDYNEAIRQGTSTATIYASRGYAHSMKYDYEPALSDISKAISIDPTVAGYYNSRGLYYNNLGQYALAVADYKTCIEKDPNYSSAYINIISPLTRMKQFTEAASIYQQFKNKKLNSYLESDNYKFYRSFINAVVLTSEGKKLYAMNSLNLAADQYGTELKAETKRAYVDIMYLLAYLLEMENQLEDAKGVYEQSLVIDSRQPDVKAALELLDQQQATTRAIDNTGPEITLISPSPSRGFDIETDNAKTQIIGKAKDIAGIASIKINDIPVTKIEEDGLFITSLVLKSGANTLTISATDKQGNSSTKSFTINSSAGAATTEPKPDQSFIPGGSPKYYAILIGEKDYDDPSIPDLQNPVKDARELKSILENNYTFDKGNIDTLYNRSREDIMQAIVQRCNSLTENDNLIIFYAGHGIAEKDKFGDIDGYWIPSSGKKGLNASYISADDINKAIKRSNAKHILVIADACFSGAFTREIPAEASTEIRKQYAVTSRKVMASGNLEPVPDNSKFIFYLKERLAKNKEKYLTAKDLFDSFYKALLSNSDNLPQYAAIKNTGDEGGEFVFIKK